MRADVHRRREVTASSPRPDAPERPFAGPALHGLTSCVYEDCRAPTFDRRRIGLSEIAICETCWNLLGRRPW